MEIYIPSFLTVLFATETDRNPHNSDKRGSRGAAHAAK